MENKCVRAKESQEGSYAKVPEKNVHFSGGGSMQKSVISPKTPGNQSSQLKIEKILKMREGYNFFNPLTIPNSR